MKVKLLITNYQLQIKHYKIKTAKYKTIILNILIPLLFAVSLLGFSGDYGTAPVFEAGSGARAAAMGNAFTAASDDTQSIYFNPAGLALIKAQEFSLLHYQLYEGALYNSAAYAQALLDFGTIGAAFYRYSAGTVPGYDINDMKTGDITFQEYKATLSYAFNIRDAVRLGVNINVINSSMDSQSSTGIGVDAGVLYEPFDFMRLGFMARNIFKPVQSLGSENEGVPQVYTLGFLLKYPFDAVKASITGDISMGESESLKGRAGIEIVFYGALSLRAGYDSGRYSFGGGIEAFGARVDYAYMADSYLDSLQRISLTYSFGLSLDEQGNRKKAAIMGQVRKIVEEKLKAKEKENAAKHYALAYEAYQKGDYETALNEADKALEWKEDTKEADVMKNMIARMYYNESVRAQKAGNYVAALEKIKDTLRARPGFSGAQELSDELSSNLRIKKEAKASFSQGGALYAQKDYSGAIKAWQDALALDSANENLKSYIASARRMQKGARTGDATTAAQAEEVKKLYYEGINAYTAGDLEKALEIWRQALKLDPSDVRSARGVEKAALELEEYKKRGLQ